MREGDSLQTSFCFLKKLYMRKKEMTCNLVSITFDCPQLGKQLKQKIQNFKILTRDMLFLNFFGKGLGIVSLSFFVYDFSREKFLMLYFIN